MGFFVTIRGTVTCPACGRVNPDTSSQINVDSAWYLEDDPASELSVGDRFGPWFSCSVDALVPLGPDAGASHRRVLVDWDCTDCTSRQWMQIGLEEEDGAGTVVAIEAAPVSFAALDAADRIHRWCLEPLIGGDALRQLVHTLWVYDCRAGRWCAARCARAVLHLATPGDTRPAQAIAAAEQLASEGVDREALWHASRGAVEASRGSATRVAFHAALAAAESASDLRSPEVAVWHVLLAAVADPGPGEADRAIEAARRFAELDALVRDLRWPLTVPTAGDLKRAPANLRRAWHAVEAQCGDRPLVEQIDSRERAGRAGLDWNHPLHRAIAERVTEDAALAALLEG